MKILVTGADGFIGKNLCVRLEENSFELIKIDRSSSKHDLELGLINADFIFHLAGINRPKNESEFHEGNASLTEEITHFLIDNKKQTPIMLSSSIQANNNNNKYGESKKLAENHIEMYGLKTNANYYIYRLPNVFGKWCKPNYNSFIATFCHNIANDIDIVINSPTAKISLIYIDDLCNELISLLNGNNKVGFQNISPIYEATVNEVADLLYAFKNSRNTLITENVGVGFTRALYSTWLSYLSPQQFTYSVPHYGDQRGVFCEMLKTQHSGQFSFFTAHPGITRGGHYHHTKTEKFLIIKGKALFKFENIITGEKYELTVSDHEYKIVETVPGWSHDITNIADSELIVMLWANEIFNKELPDTIARPL